MYEREDERKTEDSLDVKETRYAIMIVGGRGGGGDEEGKDGEITRDERNRDT